MRSRLSGRPHHPRRQHDRHDPGAGPPDGRTARHGLPAAHPGLAPEPGDITVRKTRYGALSTTDLDRQLRDRGITTLVIAGISTSGAVLSTVTDAADRDYQLYVLSDGVTDPDPQAHQTLMAGVFPRLAHIIDTAELRSLLHASRPDRANTGRA
ncbi:cysteine hydrolase [Nonomuraea sp. NPDC003804]|uniref:cysteine hydrolase n=1 Tax=Nonomuraea sp. NPDC003804 TaxID=3154547 RepID=UPI0033BE3657